jgi:hypothetical protein
MQSLKSTSFSTLDQQNDEAEEEEKLTNIIVFSHAVIDLCGSISQLTCLELDLCGTVDETLFLLVDILSNLQLLEDLSFKFLKYSCAYLLDREIIPDNTKIKKLYVQVLFNYNLLDMDNPAQIVNSSFDSSSSPVQIWKALYCFRSLMNYLIGVPLHT